MDDSMNIIEISESFQNTHSYSGNDLDGNRAHFFVDGLEGATVHVFHADADVRIGEVRTITFDDVAGVALVHDLELTSDLFANTGLGIYQHDLVRDWEGCRWERE